MALHKWPERKMQSELPESGETVFVLQPPQFSCAMHGFWKENARCESTSKLAHHTGFTGNKLSGLWMSSRVIRRVDKLKKK